MTAFRRPKTAFSVLLGLTLSLSTMASVLGAEQESNQSTEAEDPPAKARPKLGRWAVGAPSANLRWMFKERTGLDLMLIIGDFLETGDRARRDSNYGLRLGIVKAGSPKSRVRLNWNLAAQYEISRNERQRSSWRDLNGTLFAEYGHSFGLLMGPELELFVPGFEKLALVGVVYISFRMSWAERFDYDSSGPGPTTRIFKGWDTSQRLSIGSSSWKITNLAIRYYF